MVLKTKQTTLMFVGRDTRYNILLQKKIPLNFAIPAKFNIFLFFIEKVFFQHNEWHNMTKNYDDAITLYRFFAHQRAIVFSCAFFFVSHLIASEQNIKDWMETGLCFQENVIFLIKIETERLRSNLNFQYPATQIKIMQLNSTEYDF